MFATCDRKGGSGYLVIIHKYCLGNCFIYIYIYKFYLCIILLFKKNSCLDLFHISLGCVDFLLTKHVATHPFMFSFFE